MKGQYFLIPVVISAFIVVILFVVLSGFIYSSIIKTNIEEKTFSEELNIKNAAYLMEKCLKEKGDFISMDFLEKNKDKSISCATKEFGVKIKDLETEKTWDFNHDEEAAYKYDIFVNIIDGSEIHAGRLYVSS